MGELSKDRLMRLQVEQLEKEKKDLHERLRIAAKRIDHIERAYRKEERPLLAQDYAEQQAADRATFEALQKARTENSLAAHNHALASKKRLRQMQDDFRAHREQLLTARAEEYQRRKATGEKMMKEEKDARRQAFAEQKEAERKQQEEAEAAARKAEEERLRVEAGACLIFFLFWGWDVELSASCRTTCSGGSRGDAETTRRGAARGAAEATRTRARCFPRGSAQEGAAGTGCRGTGAPACAGQDGRADGGTTYHYRGCMAVACATQRGCACALGEPSAVARHCCWPTQDWHGW